MNTGTLSRLRMLLLGMLPIYLLVGVGSGAPTPTTIDVRIKVLVVRGSNLSYKRGISHSIYANLALLCLPSGM